MSEIEESLELGASLERLALQRSVARDGLAARIVDLAPGLPFRLGESARDFAVPFAWDDEIDELATAAVEGLGNLLAARRPGAPPGAFALRRGLPPLCVRFLSLAAEHDPHLEPQLAALFWDGPGGALAEALRRVFVRALEEELGSPTREPFGPLAVLAAASLAGKVKALAPRGMTYERLEKAVGFALFSLSEAASRVASAEIRARAWPLDPVPSLERLRLWSNPLCFISIRQRALQNAVNPWLLPEELASAFDAKVSRRLEAVPPLERAAAALEQLQAEPRLRELASAAGRRARFRRGLLELLLRHDRGGDDQWSRLRSAWLDDGQADELLRDPKALGGAVAARLQPLLQPLSGPGADLDDLRASVDAALAYELDRQTADELDRNQRTLRDERPGAGREELVQRYTAGRLYRLSGDGKPLLRGAEQGETGYLFVDLKGFTQRTVRVKEISVADFLQREFYEPILAAARGLASVDRGDLRLLNLLGDAAAFAGEIPTLVALSTEIRRICAEYERKLARLSPTRIPEASPDARLVAESRATAAREPLLLERTLLEGEISRKQSVPLEGRRQELERQVASRAAQLAQAFQEVRARLQQATPAERAGIQAEMARISVAQEQLVSRAELALARIQEQPEAERAETLFELLTARERARLEELDRELGRIDTDLARELAEIDRASEEEGAVALEAGVFISHGASPEEIRFEDPLFGEVRVAIGERLNEAARGTARSGKVLMEVEAEVAASGKRGVRTPFGVHVERGDGERLGSEIYNSGQAVSARALDVFLRETLGERFHFERRLARADRAPELEAALPLPAELRLIVSVGSSPGDVLVFREVGGVRFRGFERSHPCLVFELLAADGSLAKLLARHHLPKWVQEARLDRASLLSGLPGAS